MGIRFNGDFFLLSVSGEWQAAPAVSVMPNRWSTCVSVDRQFIGCGESDAAPCVLLSSYTVTASFNEPTHPRRVDRSTGIQQTPFVLMKPPYHPHLPHEVHATLRQCCTPDELCTYARTERNTDI
ncbi:hypothetical protein V1478_004001 [Vespula squamosa]|uniref:Uncharacterized protein n=1 Tax=Vespula squamosa TaxID=30214 RepID=A0ABD2BNE5_VESSQ